MLDEVSSEQVFRILCFTLSNSLGVFSWNLYRGCWVASVLDGAFAFDCHAVLLHSPSYQQASSFLALLPEEAWIAPGEFP